ncbi:hypothetical protein I316_01772 [Kwoniella heveanensis BCC8398]|uniref:mRNA 3'-end-processing protein RNA14 n=1 Tax=Kwoniella heveanensis BCC8398 TaxID=1296120 RepID=A0A1B9GZS2_9TREE|nr:hypothetical protein I316_01772 [Kwoniella heveanensis BCC8398]
MSNPTPNPSANPDPSPALADQMQADVQIQEPGVSSAPIAAASDLVVPAAAEHSAQRGDVTEGSVAARASASALGTEPGPAQIVEQLQTLTDIEGDLAETALAVMGGSASTHAGSGSAAGTNTSTGTAATQAEQRGNGEGPRSGPGVLGEDEDAEGEEEEEEEEVEEAAGDGDGAAAGAGAGAGAEAEAENALLENAEAMEGVLESSIPDAPADQPVSTPTHPTTASSTATEALNTLSAVNANLNEPILSSAAIEPAHDTPTETVIEEDSSRIQVDVVEPSLANIVAAAKNAENAALPQRAHQADGAIAGDIDGNVDEIKEEGVIAPLPTPAPAQQTPVSTAVPNPYSASAPVPDTQFQNQVQPVPATQEHDVPLPDGLNESSPSVVSNRDLIQAWRADPKNPTILLSLFNWSVQRTEIIDARLWYNALAVDNPTAVQPLLALINLELALSNFPQVEALFATALKGPSGGVTAAADVSIWKAYLHYIRRQNPIADGAPNADTVRSTITKAYEFALKECGYDRESGDIWDEYIRFVATTPTKNHWEVQAQQDNLRKLYTRAVCIPLNNLETLWKAYDSFESTVNKATSKKFLAERSPAYMTARTALRELKALTDGLPHPILPLAPTFSESDRATVAGWKAYLKWEEGNPLVIEDEGMLQSRIAYAIRKCLAEMRHFPELWHYSANYYLKLGKKDEAAGVLRAGVQACPKSFLLTFALSELLEDLNSYPAVHELFVSLIDALAPEIDGLKKTIAREVEAAKGPEIPNSSSIGDINMDGEGASEVQKMVEEREARGRLVEERRGKEVDELVRGVNVAWIMYMRFARRAEGIKAARGVFGKARKSPYLSWHTFEASAMMEYHSNKDSAVAIRIFELGLKLFSEEVEYVIKYLQFLLSVNDDTNARALFERSALKILPAKSRPLWDTWARYEYLYGDLSAVHKLETRFVEVFPNDSPLKRFAQRYTYNGVDQIALVDLGFGAVKPVAPAPAPVPIPGANSVQSSVPLQPGASAGGPPPSPGGYKRPAPDSPRREGRSHGPGGGGGGGGHDRRGSVDRSPKRYRAHSPIPPPRRYPDREPQREREPLPPPRDRTGSGRFSQPPMGHGHGPHGNGPVNGRERSPMIPPGAGGGVGPGSIGGRRDDRPPMSGGPPPPPLAGGGMMGAPTPAGATMDRDRSGLGRALVWFIGNLPSSRSFDGPTFRPDDIIGLFSNIAPNGASLPVPTPMNGGGGGAGGPPLSRGGGGGGYPERELQLP